MTVNQKERITAIDKCGNFFQMGVAHEEDFSPLMDMYRVFSPKPASQGVPPEDPQTCYEWVRKLFELGENLLAWRDNILIGHAALIPNLDGKSAEFVIFVHQSYRNHGIGTALTRLTLEEARENGLSSVWLTVALTNFFAIKLYKSVGFQFCDSDIYERTMVVRL